MLATTNHPERLDPAILDRPSRFDRRYHFELPAEAERRTFIASWNGALQEEMRLSDAAAQALAGLTDDFSFAYLKELFLSSMMQWIAETRAGRMDEIALARVEVLRAQLSRAEADGEKAEGDGGETTRVSRGLRRRYAHRRA